jgi:hypothetical protein
MRFTAVACLSALMTIQAPTPTLALEGPQKSPAEPPLEAIVAHFFPGYVPVALGDLAPEIGALTVQDAAYNHSDRSPTSIRADFDGNGYPDYAVLIKTRSSSGSDEIFTILMGYGGGRYAMTMESFFGRLSEDIYLGYLPPGVQIRRTASGWPPSGAGVLTLDTPSVTLNLLREAADVFYWDETHRRFGRASLAD